MTRADCNRLSRELLCCLDDLMRTASPDQLAALQVAAGHMQLVIELLDEPDPA